MRVQESIYARYVSTASSLLADRRMGGVSWYRVALAALLVLLSTDVSATPECQKFSTVPRNVPGGILETEEFVPGSFVGAGFISTNEIVIATNNDEGVKTIAQVIDTGSGAVLREFVLDLASQEVTTCLANGTMSFTTIGYRWGATGIMLLQSSLHFRSGAPLGQVQRSRLIGLYDDGRLMIHALNIRGLPWRNNVAARQTKAFDLINIRTLWMMLPNRRGRRLDLGKGSAGKPISPQVFLSSTPKLLAVHPGGKFLFVIGLRGAVVVKQYIRYDNKFRTSVDVDPLDLGVLSLEASPNGLQFAAVFARANDTVVKVYNVDPLKLSINLAQTISAHSIGARKVQFNSDGSGILVVGSGTSERVWVCSPPPARKSG